MINANAPRSSTIGAALAREYYEGRLHLATEILLPAVLNQQDRWAALRILNVCSEATRDRVALPEGIATWLADVLLKISEGDSIEEACGIPPRRRGAKKEGLARSNAERQFMMAFHYGVRHKFESIKALGVEKEIGELFQRSTHAVRKAWKEHKSEVLREIELEVKYFGAPWPVRNRKK